MHAVGFLAWRILFSLTFMSHLNKEISCESIVHGTDNGFDQNIPKIQTQEMITEYMKQDILNLLGINQTTKPSVLIPGRNSSGQEDASQRCQRHELYVNFTTLGYTGWIIAPAGYMAYYCAGECNIPMSPTTNHTAIKYFMHTLNPNIPKPCCVPTVLSPLNVTTKINSTVETETWGTMVVDECGCS